MKERGNTSKSLLIALAVIAAVGFFGYLYLTREPSVEDDLLLVESSGTTGVDGDLLKALQELRTIKLDLAIFSEPVFRSFQDFGNQLTPQTPGRPNPFAPITSSTGVTPAQGQSVSQ